MASPDASENPQTPTTHHRHTGGHPDGILVKSPTFTAAIEPPTFFGTPPAEHAAYNRTETMNDPGAKTDERLIEDYLEGDHAALQSIIERYHDDLMRFLRRMTGSHALAEDVFQDTFLQIHQSIRTFDTSRRFKPWLFTIAANKARDALRRDKRRKAASLSANATEDGPAFVDLMAIDLPGPELPLEHAERNALVQSAIDDMPLRQREILLLAYFQRLSYQQIADLFGIPLGTVKSRLHAAVASFAKRWQAQVDRLRSNQGDDSEAAPPG
jgi:RNA polymerase sigma-70 factor (ECF subfamily)